MNVRRVVRLLVAILLCGAATPHLAQVTTATLYGIVQDQSGATIPGTKITLTHDAYTRLRANPRTFAIVPGHEAPDVEDVVERNEGYYVVEKKPGVPAAIAESDQ